jgi:hypothetical protein
MGRIPTRSGTPSILLWLDRFPVAYPAPDCAPTTNISQENNPDGQWIPAFAGMTLSEYAVPGSAYLRK